MKKKEYYWLAAGILLIAANLRLPITMMPPILPWLQSQLGFATSMSGLLTTIPLIMFALLSPIIAQWSRRWGNLRVLLVSLIILTIGCYLRSLTQTGWLLAGTVLIGVGIAGGNVLLPAVIQQFFPRKTTILTSLYTFIMGLIASLGTGISAPLVKATNLSVGISVISLLSLTALLVWIRVFWGWSKQDSVMQNVPEHSQKSPWRLYRFKLTWLITFFFGAQSLLYYSLLTWLPVYWTQAGFSAATSGMFATLFQLCGMPLALLTPVVARKKSGMAAISTLIGGGIALGLTLLLVSQRNLWFNTLLAILMGIASGASFSLAVVFFQRKTSTIWQTAEMSGLAQSVGYLLAAVGPALSGVVRSATHSWFLVFGAYIVIAILLWLAGVIITVQRPIDASE